MSANNKSISRKLFTITLGLILGVFFITLFFQLLFFEDFYLYKKKLYLLNQANEFRYMYSYEINNNQVLSSALTNYEEKNSSRVAIIPLYRNDFVYVSNNQNSDNNFSTLTNFCAELLSNTNLINAVLEENKPLSTIFTNRSRDSKQIGIVAPMSLQNENDALFISVSSIQPIKEAGSVIRTFYFYLLIGFIIVATFLSIVYANLIAKPLKNLNNIARKMSNLDFSVKCDVTSDDEIGSLAMTLNFLSANLKKSLDDLKEKNIQLEADIEKERELETMRKDFVASVSHDLKTPIGIISGYAEGLKDGIVSPENAQIYLETIIDEAGKMNTLVTSMLELSKLESNSMLLQIESFNIVRLINAKVKNLSLELKDKDITVNYLDIPDFAYVQGDILKIEQVIQILITNSIKYTPGGNNINISIIENADNFEISIENTGTHIPEEELDNIFIKFYKLDKSGNRSTNSFGLGLAIVQKILELHNSTFSMTNSLNGVLFKFTLSKADDDNLN